MTITETVATPGDTTLLDGIEMSEPGNAERLALIARGRIHYVDTWNTWIVFRDGRWEQDNNGISIQAFAKMVPQSIFTLASTLKPEPNVTDSAEDTLTPEQAKALAWYKAHQTWARKSNTEPSLKRMANLARDLPGMRITSDDMDSKPHLLNMLNGTYDFSADEFRLHDPGDLITKMAKVWYDPMAPAPLWNVCLDQWQPDKDIQRFLQSITGSGLLGVPVQNLFVNIGAGRNGKGTFYKHIQMILGDYASTAPEDMLVESHNRVHDEQRARLRGIRMLIAPETSIGDRLDEAGIKNMTGGDMINARHLYGKPFDFMPSHTAFLHTNYEPQIRGTDPGIWNRVIKIPWDTYIKEDQRDLNIDQKLKTEHSGILNWLIAGTRDWLAHGLRKPAVISRETETYRADQDMIGRFLEDSLEAIIAESNSMGAIDYIPAATLRKHYESWCMQEGTKPWVAQNVGKELRHKGWVPTTKRAGKAVLKAWTCPTTPDSVTRSQTTPGHSTAVTPLLPVTTLSGTNPIVELERERINRESNRESAETRLQSGYPVTHETYEPTEADLEQSHREWLYDHGYPVPPTDAEIEAYLANQGPDDDGDSDA